MFKMATPQKVVLLACGSFNPPTIMHLRLFELARDELQRAGKYDVIAGIMSPVSDAYKKKDLAPAEHRCALVKLALKTSRWVRLDTWESEQPSWLQTVKVLRHHKSILNNQANTTVKCTPSKKRKKDMKNEDNIEKGSPISTNNKDASGRDNIQLKLLCGGDLLESFAVPGLWEPEDIEEIIKNFGLVCITRHGSDPRKFIYDSDILTKLQDSITIVTEWIQQDISSTKIRTALRRSESVKYLLQDSVIDYIKDHGLYGVNKDNKYLEKTTPSPMSDIMEYVEAGFPNETITIISAKETPTKSSRVSTDRPVIDGSSMSPRRLQGSPARLSRGMSPSSSPRRMMEENDSDPERSNSPKTPPQNVACLTDIGTIVRRVRNYNMPGLFQPKKIQPK